MRDRTCIWCGGRPGYSLLIRRFREVSFRNAIRFEVCDWHAAEIVDRLEKVLAQDPYYRDRYEYLINHLRPRSA